MHERRTVKHLTAVNMFMSLAITLGCGSLSTEQREATNLIEAHLNSFTEVYLKLPVGQVEIVDTNRQRPDSSKGQVSGPGWFTFLEKEGLLSITANQDLTSNSSGFSWDNFAALSQRGIVRKMTVVASQKALELHGCPAEANARPGTMLCVKRGAGSVEEIVRSEKFDIGTRQMWLLMGNHRWRPSQTLEKFISRKGDAQMKFIAIALRDPFTKTWTISEEDFESAERSYPFTRQGHFDQVLAAAQRRDSPAPRN